ncbi:hypothetical protein PDR5_35350 [Pseudomonas sp. DR 5-09]|nr:hypothetical protein PDR5_35350 [Pseudomonas sp. DR 5-09]
MLYVVVQHGCGYLRGFPEKSTGRRTMTLGERAALKAL